MSLPLLEARSLEWDRNRETRERLLAKVAAPVRDRYYRHAAYFKTIPQWIADEFSTFEIVMPKGAE